MVRAEQDRPAHRTPHYSERQRPCRHSTFRAAHRYHDREQPRLASVEGAGVSAPPKKRRCGARVSPRGANASAPEGERPMTAPPGALTWASAAERNRKLIPWRRAVSMTFAVQP